MVSRKVVLLPGMKEATNNHPRLSNVIIRDQRPQNKMEEPIFRIQAAQLRRMIGGIAAALNTAIWLHKEEHAEAHLSESCFVLRDARPAWMQDCIARQAAPGEGPYLGHPHESQSRKRAELMN